MFFSIKKISSASQASKRYPGRPDVVLPKYKTAVFVHGCFWHLHEGCKYAKMPKSNVEYWEEKLYKNRERDARNQEELKAMGWTVLTVWECELKKDKREETLEILYDKITSQVFLSFVIIYNDS